MNRLNKWLVEKYFPNYTYKKVLDENQRLKEALENQDKKNREYKAVIRELIAEIDGLKYGIRHNKITIINGEKQNV